MDTDLRCAFRAALLRVANPGGGYQLFIGQLGEKESELQLSSLISVAQ